MLTDSQINEIKTYLKKNKLTQTEFAHQMGITFTTLNRYLIKRRHPSISIKKFINHLTGINLEN